MTCPSWVAPWAWLSFIELDKAVVRVIRLASFLWTAGCNGPHRSVAKNSYASPKVRGGGQEELPHVQGEVAARVQEGQEELFHVQGQEGWL